MSRSCRHLVSRFAVRHRGILGRQNVEVRELTVEAEGREVVSESGNVLVIEQPQHIAAFILGNLYLEF